MTDANVILYWFQQGLLPEVRALCMTDEHGNSWTDLDKLVMFAHGKHLQLKAMQVAARITAHSKPHYFRHSQQQHFTPKHTGRWHGRSSSHAQANVQASGEGWHPVGTSGRHRQEQQLALVQPGGHGNRQHQQRQRDGYGGTTRQQRGASTSGQAPSHFFCNLTPEQKDWCKSHGVCFRCLKYARRPQPGVPGDGVHTAGEANPRTGAPIWRCSAPAYSSWPPVNLPPHIPEPPASLMGSRAGVNPRG